MSEPAPIRLLIVDDHKVVREGLRSFLGTEPGIEVVGEAADGRQALDRVMSLGAEGLRPDVVLMDLEMQPVDGIEATREIRSRYPEVEVVAVTSFVEEDRVHAALDAGAAGYLLKDADADELDSCDSRRAPRRADARPCPGETADGVPPRAPGPIPGG